MCSCSHFNFEGGEWGLVIVRAALRVEDRVVNAVTNEKRKTISIKRHGTQVVGYQNT
jgi:hypothetical protein